MRGIGIGVEISEDELQGLMEEILATAEAIDDTTPVLTQIAIDIQTRMKAGRWNDGPTADLRRSIRAYVQDNTISIRMLYYGYFLSFGTRSGAKSPLTAEVASVFDGKQEGSFFNTPDNNRGIARRSFYPTDIQDLIVNKLEAIALQNLED